MKRLCIYFFYDKDGIIDDYVFYYIDKIKEFCSEICFVVNGFLTPESAEKIAGYCDKVIIRKNTGFDAWAYKEGLMSYGFDYIAKNYDEVILNNFTVFGPIVPFSVMFDKMDNSECDFWGHCRYYPKLNQFVRNEKIPEHLMSYFIVFKKKILKSKYFKEYFDTLKPISDYDESRLFHEFRLTPYFQKLGFISDSYINDKKNQKLKGINTSVRNAYRQLIEDKSPLLKRKSLYIENNKFMFNPVYNDYNKLLKKIYDDNLYDLRMCFDNLIRTENFGVSFKYITKKNFLKYYILGKLLRIKKYRAKYKMTKNRIDMKLIKNSER